MKAAKTLEECKDEVAKKHGIATTIFNAPLTREKMLIEAFELREASIIKAIEEAKTDVFNLDSGIISGLNKAIQIIKGEAPKQ